MFYNTDHVITLMVKDLLFISSSEMHLLSRNLVKKWFYVKELIVNVNGIITMSNIFRAFCGLHKLTFLAMMAYDISEVGK